MENFEKCTVAMLGGPCSQHVTAISAPKCYNNVPMITHPGPMYILSMQTLDTLINRIMNKWFTRLDHVITSSMTARFTVYYACSHWFWQASWRLKGTSKLRTKEGQAVGLISQTGTSRRWGLMTVGHGACDVTFWHMIVDIGLGMRPVNERRRYIVTTSLISWTHTRTDPCGCWNVTEDDKWSGMLRRKVAVVPQLGFGVMNQHDAPKTVSVKILESFGLWSLTIIETPLWLYQIIVSRR